MPAAPRTRPHRRRGRGPAKPAPPTPKPAALPRSPLEETESLEQLRVLWHGYRIAVAVSETDIAPGVDTPQDLEAVRRMLA
jgi:hypothetical protein